MVKYILKLSIKIASCYIFLLLIYPILIGQNSNIYASLPAVALAKEGSTTRFLYDGDGARVAKIEEGKTTLYIGNMEKNFATGEVTKYYSIGSKKVAVKTSPSADGDDSGLNYIVSEHLGSLRALSDSSGNFIAGVNYYPYGTVRVKTGTTIASRQYTSQINDDSTGFYFYNARYYNPQTANFISGDTKIDGLNRYAYVLGNPFKYTDPSGHDAQSYDPDDSYQDPVFRPLMMRWEDYLEENRRANGGSIDNIQAINYLIELIYNNIPYSPSAIELMSRIPELEATIKYAVSKAPGKKPHTEELELFIEEKKAELAEWQKIHKQWETDVKNSHLADRYKKGLFFCNTFADFTADIIYDYLGISSSPVGAAELQHAFIGLIIDDKPYIVDPTWGIGVTPLYTDMQNRSYKELGPIHDDHSFWTKRGGGNVGPELVEWTKLLNYSPSSTGQNYGSYYSQ